MRRYTSAIMVSVFMAAFLALGSCRMTNSSGKSLEDGFIALAQSDPTRARMMMSDSMDLAALCRSVRRQECFACWIGLYETAESATAAAEHALLRMKDDSVHLVRMAVNSICRAMVEKGWMESACSIAAFQYGIDSRQYPHIADRLLTAALLPGRQSPPIEGLRPSAKTPSASVVMFYESRCRTCMDMLSELEVNYSILKQAGIRVITISTDTDRERFESLSGRFPWPDVLCDTQGYEGVNMMRWGVAATPTLFVFGQDGKILGQYDSIEEVWELLAHRLKMLRSDNIRTAGWRGITERLYKYDLHLIILSNTQGVRLA